MPNDIRLLIFLLFFPFLCACVFAFLKKNSLRDKLVIISSFVIFLAVLGLFAAHFHHDVQFFAVKSAVFDWLVICAELLIAIYIIYAGIKYKRYWAVLLIAVQVFIISAFRLVLKDSLNVINDFFIDKFSVLMALIIGIVGGLICIWSTGYMRVFHERQHTELKDNRAFFFCASFAFLSAMFGLVFSNNLLWLYFFWELTTLCSFLLIGYKRTDEARDSAFAALEPNLLGGLAFAAGIVYLYATSGKDTFDASMLPGRPNVMVAVALFCLAGLIKSAQPPFSSWLPKAMVAPAPVSALLHASTMVKAGVYLILRFALVLGNTLIGYFLALIGGLSFLVFSLAAVSQNQAKKVLSYSTIANLGLIVMCAAIGTFEAMWAALLLILFHAVTKALLFLCAGEIEQTCGSADIEDMSGLIKRMPKVSVMMQIGMAGMFLAPFGMLISKWAVIRAIVDYNPMLEIFLVFGSAATIFFWVKWMGRLVTVCENYGNIEGKMNRADFLPLLSLSALTVGLCLFFPLTCRLVVEPYLIELYDKTVIINQENLIIMFLMLGMVVLFPLSFLYSGRKAKIVAPYLGAANSGQFSFRGQGGKEERMEMKNYYLAKYLGEDKLLPHASLICGILLIAVFAVAWVVRCW